MGFKVFRVNDLLQSLDSVAASIDSNNSILQMLQVIDATYDSAYGGRKKYYDSTGALPTPSNELVGMIVSVHSGQSDTGNALYLCNENGWAYIQNLNESA